MPWPDVGVHPTAFTACGFTMGVRLYLHVISCEWMSQWTLACLMFCCMCLMRFLFIQFAFFPKVHKGL